MGVTRLLAIMSPWLMPTAALAWVTLGSSHSPPMPIALDPAGRPIVLGTETGRVLLRKLDPATGVEDWVTVVSTDGLHSPHDSLDVDAAGNAVVLIQTVCPSPGPCVGPDVVAKFSGADGSLLWSVEVDEARDASIDAAGNVFVLEDTAPHVLLETFVLSRLDAASGAQDWATPPFAVALRDVVVVDPAGDAIVFSDLAAGNETAFKLAGASGALVWQEPVGFETLIAAATDASGDVIAGGTTPGGRTVVKLAAADGQEIWNSSPAAAFFDVLVDAAGDVVLGAGRFNSAGVEKLSGGDGTQAWAQPTPASRLFAVRPDGDVLAQVPSTGLFRYDGATGDILGFMPDFGVGYFMVVGERGVLATDVGVDSRNRNVVAGIGSRLSGRKLIVVDNALDAAKSKLVVQSKDPLFAPPAPPLLVGDPQEPQPTVGGMVLTLTNPLTLESATLPFPAARWVGQQKSQPGAYSYVYKDDAGAVPRCKARLKNPGKLKVSCTGGLGGFTLDEPSQSQLDVTLSFGTEGLDNCMSFGGEIVLDVGSGGAGKGTFKAKDAPPAPECPGGF